jgi:ceramide glucosyltransferase
MDWIKLTTVLPTAVSASFYVGTHTVFLWTMLRRRPAPLLSVRPWVSVLKPLSGLDDDLRENLESFAALDYPAYEILFGVASPADPAEAVALAFIAAHPEVSARLVVTDPPRGAVHNPKVAQLVDLTRHARGSVIVVSDANVRVRRTYLRSLVGDLLRPGVGLVSSVIAGSGEQTLGAAIENLQLIGYVAPTVVAAHALSVRPATVGKSLAMRKVVATPSRSGPALASSRCAGAARR